jgi:hypothetical protein
MTTGVRSGIEDFSWLYCERTKREHYTSANQEEMRAGCDLLKKMNTEMKTNQKYCQKD